MEGMKKPVQPFLTLLGVGHLEKQVEFLFRAIIGNALPIHAAVFLFLLVQWMIFEGKMPPYVFRGDSCAEFLLLRKISLLRVNITHYVKPYRVLVVIHVDTHGNVSVYFSCFQGVFAVLAFRICPYSRV